MSDEQKEQLLYIADLHSPERGYAHALLSLLDGQEFWDSYELPQSFSLQQPNFQQEQECQGLWVYPNPSNGQVKLRLPEYVDEGETVSLQVFGLDGRQVEERQLNTVRATLDFSNLEPGLYLLEAWGRNGALGKAVITIF